MHAFDFSPLFRSTIGFDRVSRLLDSAMATADRVDNYPPYNIEKTGETSYRLTLAVAGFSKDDLDISAQENQLVVRGKMQEETDEERRYLHRGIAGRAFERTFQLADHIRVANADLANGLLHIELEREIPEALKPRKIEIAAKGNPKWLGKAA